MRKDTKLNTKPIQLADMDTLSAIEKVVEDITRHRSRFNDNIVLDRLDWIVRHYRRTMTDYKSADIRVAIRLANDRCREAISQLTKMLDDESENLRHCLNSSMATYDSMIDNVDLVIVLIKMVRGWMIELK